MKASKEKALHDLNAIKMTMKTQNTKEEYEAMLDNFDSAEQFINHHTESNEEVERALIQRIVNEMECSIFNEEGTIDYIVIEALKEIDNLKECSVSDYEWVAYTLNIIKQCQNFIKTTEIKQALTTPKISDSEVEELFMLLEEDYMRQTYDRFGVNETYQLKDDKDWSQLKTKFQQMQQEIDRLTKYAKGFVSISHHDYKLIQENEKKNQKYKQLLDKIELKECYNPKCTLVNGVMIGESLVNILKELKSIGGNK